MQVSVVIGTYNRLPFLKKTVQSVRDELKGIDHEIIVVDGGSDDGTLHWLTKQKDIVTIVQHNHGQWAGRRVRQRSWGYFMNLAFKCSQGKYVCMLSDDCLVVPGAIVNGLRLFEERLARGQKVGGAAFYWRNWPEQRDYWIGLTFGSRMFVNHGLFLRDALEKVGYVEEEAFNFYHADGDLCLRMWEEGYEFIESTDSYVEHHSHANQTLREANLLQQKADWSEYEKRWRHLGSPDRDWIVKGFEDPNKTAERYFGKGIAKTASRLRRALHPRLS
jgi:glycosyltransferase involved in cell wall biosynthesis